MNIPDKDLKKIMQHMAVMNKEMGVVQTEILNINERLKEHGNSIDKIQDNLTRQDKMMDSINNKQNWSIGIAVAIALLLLSEIVRRAFS